jgi:hypothetical protein
MELMNGCLDDAPVVELELPLVVARLEGGKDAIEGTSPPGLDADRTGVPLLGVLVLKEHKHK